MKLKEYLEICEPGAEITCCDKDIDSEFYFYPDGLKEPPSYLKEFPNVWKCNTLLVELLDVACIREDGIEVNLYELLDNPKVIEFAKQNLFEKHQYKDDGDIVMMLFDDNVKNFSNGFEGFSELMVHCLTSAYLPEQSKGLTQAKMTFRTTDHELTKYNGTEVEVLRPLTEDECDVEDVGTMYKVKFHDGYIRDVFQDELSDAVPQNEIHQEVQDKTTSSDTISVNKDDLASFVQLYINELEDQDITHVEIVYMLLDCFKREDLERMGFGEFIEDVLEPNEIAVSVQKGKSLSSAINEAEAKNNNLQNKEFIDKDVNIDAER